MNERRTALLACGVVGGLGGTVCVVLGLASPLSSVLLGSIAGLLFALLGAPRASSPGAGLLWGIGYALLLWLAGPTGIFPLLGDAPAMGMLDTARAQFPDLVAYQL